MFIFFKGKVDHKRLWFTYGASWTEFSIENMIKSVTFFTVTLSNILIFPRLSSLRQVYREEKEEKTTDRYRYFSWKCSKHNTCWIYVLFQIWRLWTRRLDTAVEGYQPNQDISLGVSDVLLGRAFNLTIQTNICSNTVVLVSEHICRALLIKLTYKQFSSK